MIAYLRGTVAGCDDESCVLLTPGGVGYELNCPTPVLASLKHGQDATLHVQTIVREDAIELFGFLDRETRDCFALLISIARLGPKTAVNILSVFTPEDLHRLVLEQDAGALTVVSGIGKKSAEHIFFELSYKLKAPVGRKGKSLGASPVLAGKSMVYRDALTGLTNLGYGEEEIRPHLDAVLKDEPDLDVSAALRAVLKRLMKK
ncbi:MAG: Holliday junction branch migration protein RuvA [Desulfovibrio sp.]|nr:Holliday junction branch migration protein RuvA [Desulfovibrio sp.]MCA1985656.1 Holliday junction branch migration protein RuvA [Desulfovibrio sp.]